jgi:predicted branched-subunit amino acid permease
MQYRARGGTDFGIFVGSVLLFWVLWIAPIVVGYLLGAQISNPQRFGVDLIMPAFFAAMLFPLWRGSRRAIPWAVAGLVAVMVQRFVPGWWFLIAGSLAGCIAGGFIDERE